MRPISLLFLIILPVIAFSQVEIITDTLVSSNSRTGASESIDVFYYNVSIEEAKLYNASKDEMVKNDILTKYVPQKTELIKVNNEYIMPHQCITIHFDETEFQQLFPSVTYSLDLVKISPFSKFSIKSSCENLLILDEILIKFYLGKIEIERLSIKNGEQIKGAFFHNLKHANSFSIMPKTNYGLGQSETFFFVGNQ